MKVQWLLGIVLPMLLITPAIAAAPAGPRAATGSAAQLLLGVNTTTPLVCSRIVLAMTVRDTGLGSIVVTDMRDDGQFQFVVTDSKGRPIPRTIYGRASLKASRSGLTPSIMMSALKPGQSSQSRTLLNKLYDMSEPGEYLVHVECYVSTGFQPKAPFIHLVSNTIRLHLKDRDPWADIPSWWKE